MNQNSSVPASPVVLVFDQDILVRTAVAAYLRGCGYSVLELGSAIEVKQVASSGHRIDIALIDVSGTESKDGFELASWLRRERPGVTITLASTVQGTAQEAGELCEKGPHRARPYDHQLLEREIRRLLAG